MIDLNKIDLTHVKNTIIQFRVSAKTKLLYIMLPESKKRFIKAILEKAIETLQNIEISEATEVKKMEFNIAISGGGEESSLLLSERLKVCEEKYRLSSEKLKICEEKIKDYEKKLEAYEEELQKLREFKERVTRLYVDYTKGVLSPPTLAYALYRTLKEFSS